MSLPSAETVLARYLYNTDGRPEYLLDNNLVRAPTPENETQVGDTLHVDMNEYMTSGGGRFANAILVSLVTNFFTSTSSSLDADGTRREYSIADMKAIVGGDEFYFFKQYEFADSVDDIAYRTFVFNSTRIVLNSDAKFVILPDGTRYIDNFALYANTDNFDFNSNDWVAWAGSAYAISQLDPSGIGRVFEIEFDDKENVQTVDYYAGNLTADIARYDDQRLSPVEVVAALSDVYDLINDLGESSVADFLTQEEPTYFDNHIRPVYYGTTGDDYITLVDVADTKLESHMGPGVALVGGSGNDILVGGDGDDVLLGGDGNDHLYGWGGYNIYRDGDGSDTIEVSSEINEIYLSDDDDVDIIVIGGPGDTYIEGGDSLDLIVIRADLFGLDPNPDLQSWTNPATGIADPTLTIPILGGFVYEESTWYRNAANPSVYGERIERVVHDDPDDEILPFIEYVTVRDTSTEIFEELTNYNVDPTGLIYDNSIFSIFYQHQYPYPPEGFTGALSIAITYFMDGVETESWIYLPEWQQGDYGIYLENMAEFSVPEDSSVEYLNDVIPYRDVEFQNYINNDGVYIVVPEAPEPPDVMAPQQLRAEPFDQAPAFGKSFAASTGVSALDESQGAMAIDSRMSSYYIPASADIHSWDPTQSLLDATDFDSHIDDWWTEIVAAQTVGDVTFNPDTIGI